MEQEKTSQPEKEKDKKIEKEEKSASSAKTEDEKLKQEKKTDKKQKKPIFPDSKTKKKESTKDDKKEVEKENKTEQAEIEDKEEKTSDQEKEDRVITKIKSKRPRIAKEKDEKKITGKIKDVAEDSEEEDETEEKYDNYSREKLVEILEETVKETDINKIKTRVALIKVAYLKATKAEQQNQLEKSISEDKAEQLTESDIIEERFNVAFSIYKQNKINYNQEQEKLKQKNLEDKLKILEELKTLINSEETLKKTYDEFKSLQNRWKEIGMVPRSEVNNLWQSYHFLVEKFFDKVKINKELRDLDLKKNLETKIELCEKAEELLLETSIIKSFKELQKLHEKYKETGPIPADKKDEVWARFKSATDKINQRRREHYTKLAEQQKNNYEAKLALCEKAEEILTRKNNNMKDWQENTDQMNELFRVWRTIGPATKQKNDEIWNRFKSCLNTFFENRREYFNKVKEQQLNNYNLKLDLCIQAEAIQDNTDWKNTKDELIKLQKEWKKIGPVPRKYSDKVWKRFRAANDHFFNKMEEYFSNIHEHETDNLKKKKELIKKVRNYEFGEDKSENLEVIKDFQRQWMDIGHVPIKEKDSIQQEFRSVINEQLEKLKISSLEIKTLNYKSKVDAIKEDSNTKQVITKERNYLNGRIKKLKDDIYLWENNVGFLANTKKAEVLKKEFDKKIKKAKDDLKIFEAKLEYLDSQL